MLDKFFSLSEKGTNVRTEIVADGLAWGFISYPFIKLLSGRGREVSWLMYILAVLFIARYCIKL